MWHVARSPFTFHHQTIEKCFSYSELALGMPFMGDFPSVVNVSFQAM